MMCKKCSQALLPRKVLLSPEGIKPAISLFLDKRANHCTTVKSVLGERFFRDQL